MPEIVKNESPSQSMKNWKEDSTSSSQPNFFDAERLELFESADHSSQESPGLFKIQKPLLIQSVVFYKLELWYLFF
jgi:hypothetical protein